MPMHRIVGNLILSLLTRVASGYLNVFDSQCGYTVASLRALQAIDPDAMFARYGYPNDLLARLRVAGARVIDVPVRAVYGANWRSGIRVKSVIGPILFVLSRALARRIWSRLSRPLAGGRRRSLAAPAVEESTWSSAS